MRVAGAPPLSALRSLGPGARVLARWGALPLLLAHFLAFPFADLPLATDVRHYVYFARLTAAGGMLYRDVFELKTPLSTLAGALFLETGQRLGADGVAAIRVGYLLLAAAAGQLAFRVHLVLARGNVLAAYVALAPCFGFWLLGGLPGIGNVPKLLMASSASAAALCLHRRAFLPAGVAAAAAWLDWQVGGLVAAGLLAGVTALPRAERARARRRALLGFLVGTLPVLAWLSSGGALSAAVGQTVLASAFRGASTWQARSVAEEMTRRGELIASACGAEWWLLVAACFGLFVAPARLRSVDTPMARLLATYHYGVVAFSVLELQGLGDLFALLHSLAFFAGLALSEAPLRASRDRPQWWRAAAVVSIAAAAVALRPWSPRWAWRPPSTVPATGATLVDQRRLAAGLRLELSGRNVSIVGPSDQRVLMERLSAGRAVVWTPATYRYYRRGPEESSAGALARVLLEDGAEVVVCDRGYDLEGATAGLFRRIRDDGAAPYGVALFAPTSPREAAECCGPSRAP
jgi:hypothetical protein